jgi:hypothetical protein
LNITKLSEKDWEYIKQIYEEQEQD